MKAPLVVDDGIHGAIGRAQSLARAAGGASRSIDCRNGLVQQPVRTLRARLFLHDVDSEGARGGVDALPRVGQGAGSPGGTESEAVDLRVPLCWVTLPTLRSLSAYDGTVVTLETDPEYEASFSVAGEGAASPSRRSRAFARIIGLADSAAFALEDGAVYLSPELAHSLLVHHDLVMDALLDRDASGPAIEVSVAKFAQEELSAAEDVEVTVAKIPAPSTKSLYDFSAVEGDLSAKSAEMDRAASSLKDFFASTRIVEDGQTLTVSRGGDSANAANARLRGHRGGRDDFFVKVVSVSPNDGKPAAVSSLRSRILLQGRSHGGIPPQIQWDSSLVANLASNPTAKTLLSLITPYFHCKLYRSPRTSVILHGPQGCRKSQCVKELARAIGIHSLDINCFDLIQPTEEKTAAVLDAAFESCQDYAPCILLLRGGHAFSQIPHQADTDRALHASLSRHIAEGNKRETAYQEERGGRSDGSQGPEANVMVVTTVDSLEDFPKSLRPIFSHEVAYDPSLESREEVLGALPRGEDGRTGEKVASFDTVGLTHRDLASVASKSLALSLLREGAAEGAYSGLGKAMADPQVSATCLEAALRETKDRIAKTIGAPKVPQVRWSDVGGLEQAKKAIIATIETPLKYPHLFSKDLKRRSGVLLFGPPGTGKTLLAKAVATEFGMNFLSVKGPELINMYVGESERNVREVFAKARGASPCVIFFDELDSLAPSRGGGGDSGGVMDRVVSQFLAELDNIQSDGKEPIFIVGATNRPDLIDSALLRPGRFDCLQYIGISSSAENKVNVLRALTRKFLLDESVCLRTLAERCPETYSGADLYALCTEAWMLAAKRVIESGDGGRSGSESDGGNRKVVVTMGDFVRALQKVAPSLSRDDLVKYQALQQKYASPR